jgi:hypothetical protein
MQMLALIDATQQAGSTGNISDLYLAGGRFESRLEYQLSSL